MRGLQCERFPGVNSNPCFDWAINTRIKREKDRGKGENKCTVGLGIVGQTTFTSIKVCCTKITMRHVNFSCYKPSTFFANLRCKKGWKLLYEKNDPVRLKSQMYYSLHRTPSKISCLPISGVSFFILLFPTHLTIAADMFPVDSRCLA